MARELSGAGVFLTFEVPPDVRRVEPRNFELSDVYFDLEGTECGGGAIIFIRDGVISMLEGYSHGGGWPDEPQVFAIRYFDGNQRDLAKVVGKIASRQLLTRS